MLQRIRGALSLMLCAALGSALLPAAEVIILDNGATLIDRGGWSSRGERLGRERPFLKPRYIPSFGHASGDGSGLLELPRDVPSFFSFCVLDP